MAREPVDKDILLIQLCRLPAEERRELFDHFCRSCCVELAVTGPNESNYCYLCEPDPAE